MPLVSISNLSVSLPPGSDRALAVEDVSLDIGRNQIVCIVGESGSGKSLTAHAVMRLLPRGVAATGGSILFEGTDLLKETPDAMRRRRGRDIAMIFQDPMAALNPVVAIGRQVAEQIRAHRAVSESQALKQAADMLGQMGLRDVGSLLKAYPHQLSGGQRQRVMIAMALSLSPKLLIADEPTTALDVTTQAQILKLIKRIQAEREMSVLLITHDFGVVADMADSVAVMRHGRVVESSDTKAVLGSPSHSYTRALIAAVPKGESHLEPPPPSAPLVKVEGLTKRFRRGGLFFRPPAVIALDDVALTLRRRHCPCKREDAAPDAPPHPDGVPGSIFFAESTPDHWRYPDRWAARPWRRCQRGARPRCRHACSGGARRRNHEALSSRIFRWPAPAHRPGPRLDAQARCADRRRAGFGAGCDSAGPGAEITGRCAPADESGDAVHHPRYAGGGRNLSPGDGDASWPGGGKRADARNLRQSRE
jgi:ABC-type dipeptide/oligopeptide/nickel transport system ATPase component